MHFLTSCGIQKSLCFFLAFSFYEYVAPFEELQSRRLSFIYDRVIPSMHQLHVRITT